MWMLSKRFSNLIILYCFRGQWLFYTHSRIQSKQVETLEALGVSTLQSNNNLNVYLMTRELLVPFIPFCTTSPPVTDTGDFILTKTSICYLKLTLPLIRTKWQNFLNCCILIYRDCLVCDCNSIMYLTFTRELNASYKLYKGVNSKSVDVFYLSLI